MSYSSEIISGGGRANKTGNHLERFVEHQLQDLGYIERIGRNKHTAANTNTENGAYYGKQARFGKSIYNTDRVCDFLIFHKALWPNSLVIECKWQQAKGSVDEKYPFAVLNIEKLGVPTILLLDGGGYKPEALVWLKSQAGPEKALIGVYTMSEFQTIINDGFLG